MPVSGHKHAFRSGDDGRKKSAAEQDRCSQQPHGRGELWVMPSSKIVLPSARRSEQPRRLEGTPVADAHHVYVALTDRREQTATYVACLDAENGFAAMGALLGAASSDPDNMVGGFGMGGSTSPAWRTTSVIAC